MVNKVEPVFLSGAECEAWMGKLLAGGGTDNRSVGCIACERCGRCSECTFCTGSAGLARCHYCAQCHDCTDCAHCRGCRFCLGCQHCIDCERCMGSAYLVRSVGCSGCNYCFGCVGLSRRDFFILNKPYDPAPHFATLAPLARELRIVTPSGPSANASVAPDSRVQESATAPSG